GQGTPEDRAEKFEQAVRQVYASMFDESALMYRFQRGLDTRDEQMALLVQRVSGSYHGNKFFPLAAGVAHSRNLYVWDSRLDPAAGAARLVYGLGTRAVDRVEGDYPRLVALDQPKLSVHSSRDDERIYSQHQVDLLDLDDNTLRTVHLSDLLQTGCADDLSEVADIDWEQTRQLKELRISHNDQWVINFRRILSDGSLAAELHRIISTLEAAYKWPVDIEFTINRSFEGKLMLSLLQCRPLQTRQLGAAVSFPDIYEPGQILLQSRGGFMGGNISMSTDYMIYIDPAAYSQLSEQQRHQTARIIGIAARRLADTAETKPVIMLIGPGRWGTSTPSLGIPVRFSEICDISILVEAAFESAGMIPEISFGSHFFLDLVETGIFYIAVIPAKGETIYRPELITSRDNQLCKLLPEWSEYQDIIYVIDTADRPFRLFSDISSQKLLIID
ncbi:MAG: pyruvate kinase, partial [Clostridiaceae bacterium]|nr:pyruvate kinase [Clostridiaceae bacterium]